MTIFADIVDVDSIIVAARGQVVGVSFDPAYFLVMVLGKYHILLVGSGIEPFDGFIFRPRVNHVIVPLQTGHPISMHSSGKYFFLFEVVIANQRSFVVSQCYFSADG